MVARSPSERRWQLSLYSGIRGTETSLIAGTLVCPRESQPLVDTPYSR